jgi:hypothetical protein
MPKLYELNEQFSELQNALESSDITTDVQELLKDSLEAIEGEIEYKIEYLIKMQKNHEGEAEMFKAEKDRLQAKQKTAENKADNLKRFIESQLLLLGYNGENKKQLQAGLWSTCIQLNNPKLEVAEDAKIAKKYYKVIPVLDKTALMQAVKAGSKFKGVKIVRTQSIRIR